MTLTEVNYPKINFRVAPNLKFTFALSVL